MVFTYSFLPNFADFISTENLFSEPFQCFPGLLHSSDVAGNQSLSTVFVGLEQTFLGFLVSSEVTGMEPWVLNLFIDY
jgi:hypothetical protein